MVFPSGLEGGASFQERDSIGRLSADAVIQVVEFRL
jgi:hypothetical protein